MTVATKKIIVADLERDMDRLIEFNMKQGVKTEKISLTQDQYRAYMRKHNNSPFYRNVMLVAR